MTLITEKMHKSNIVRIDKRLEKLKWEVALLDKERLRIVLALEESSQLIFTPAPTR